MAQRSSAGGQNVGFGESAGAESGHRVAESVDIDDLGEIVRPVGESARGGELRKVRIALQSLAARQPRRDRREKVAAVEGGGEPPARPFRLPSNAPLDRKSTRLNSSH